MSGFKSSQNYRREKHGKMLVLSADRNYVEAIIMYKSAADIMVADTHYIRSDEYDGYVLCLGRGCPACNHVTPNGNKGIRIQPKLFVPMYVLNKNGEPLLNSEGQPLVDDEGNPKHGEIQFFDRSAKWEDLVLQPQVMTKFPNPSEFVIRMTRNGLPGDMDTKYVFQAVYTNNVKSYDEICAEEGITFPEHFHSICKDVDATTMQRWLSSANSPSQSVPVGDMPAYAATPRGTLPNLPPPPSVNLTTTPDFTDDDILPDEDVQF